MDYGVEAEVVEIITIMAGDIPETQDNHLLDVERHQEMIFELHLDAK